MATDQIAVLVMAYGTPSSPEDVLPYYTHVRRGRPPTDEQLADLQRRYNAIGGVSPLAERTQAQCDGIQAALDDIEERKYVVHFGAKHATPYIEEAVRDIVSLGYSKVIGLVLAPHHSSRSVAEYQGRARTEFEALNPEIEFVEIDSWYEDPTYIDLLSTRLRNVIDEMTASNIKTLVTAHSLPTRIIEMGDDYPEQLQWTGEAIAKAAGVDDWEIAWQSAGRTPEPWIGPDILEVIRGLPDRGYNGVAICAAGFVSDHLEVLFDIDIEALGVANEVGVQLGRTSSLNDDPALMAALAERIHALA